jgi:hypothetical protein
VAFQVACGLFLAGAVVTALVLRSGTLATETSQPAGER